MHVAGLHREGYQLKDEDTKLDDTYKNKISSIFNQFPLIRSLKYCIGLLLFGICLLFCGGYNIYRERLFSGAALICLGSALGLSSFLWWNIIWRFMP